MILFLDFDGVTHHFYSLSRRDAVANSLFVFLPRLEKVLRDYPEVKIVISSEWRNHHPLDELKAFFSDDIRERIIGATPLEPRTKDFIPGRRQRQVEDFLKARGLTEHPWLAIDDEWDHYLPDANVVRCDDGFFDAEEAALREMISRLRERSLETDSPAL